MFTLLVGCLFISSCECFGCLSGSNMSTFLCISTYRTPFLTVEIEGVQVVWPSGLRRWIKAPVSQEAWVQIPQLPFYSINHLIMWWCYIMQTCTELYRNLTPRSHPSDFSDHGDQLPVIFNVRWQRGATGATGSMRLGGRLQTLWDCLVSCRLL